MPYLEFLMSQCDVVARLVVSNWIFPGIGNYKCIGPMSTSAFLTWATAGEVVGSIPHSSRLERAPIIELRYVVSGALLTACSLILPVRDDDECR